jgi:hypothetical protein
MMGTAGAIGVPTEESSPAARTTMIVANASRHGSTRAARMDVTCSLPMLAHRRASVPDRATA